MNSTQEVLLIRVTENGYEERADQVATEAPCHLIVNGEPLVSLLCSPMELNYIAIGFLISEGLLTNKNDLKNCHLDEKTSTVTIELSNLKSDWQRQFHTKTLTSGCGKGITFSDTQGLDRLPHNRTPIEISINKVNHLLKQFRDRSVLFQQTGGLHSAAITDDQNILLFSEDIGRHNAVDRLIGKSFLKGLSLTNKILLSSGRISGEIMTKVIRSQIPVLITRAAPTCMSINAAEEHGVTLIGFARGKRMNIYTHPQNISFDKHVPTE